MITLIYVGVTVSVTKALITGATAFISILMGNSKSIGEDLFKRKAAKNPIDLNGLFNEDNEPLIFLVSFLSHLVLSSKLRTLNVFCQYWST